MSETIRLRGLIIPLDVNRFGRPMGVGIETDDFRQYIVREGYKSQKLLNRLFDEVEIIGMVIGEDTAGNSIIDIETITEIIHKDKMEGLLQ
ncbi:hypothetical protein JXO52_10560 [bacterium]|nr:hypothetical protein [bacterium]